MTPDEYAEEPTDGHAPSGYHEAYGSGQMSPDDVPQMLDFLGIDSVILLSHLMLAYPGLTADDTRAVELSRGTIEFMLDQIVDPSNGVYTALPMPYHDVDAALELFDGYKDEDGICAICLVTSGAEPPLGNRRYEPIYEAAESAGLPVIFHTGGSGLDSYHTKGYETFIETHTLGFLEGNMSQLTSVVIQGIPEKFSDLDIVFQESGIMYVPLMMNRLDEEYMKRPSEAPMLERKPSEYIKEMFFGTQPMERPPDNEFFRKLVESMNGTTQLMYASDYPHWDFDRPNRLENEPVFSESEKDRILGETAAEVFGI